MWEKQINPPTQELLKDTTGLMNTLSALLSGGGSNPGFRSMDPKPRGWRTSALVVKDPFRVGAQIFGVGSKPWGWRSQTLGVETPTVGVRAQTLGVEVPNLGGERHKPWGWGILKPPACS